jgi:hypothetical protein
MLLLGLPLPDHLWTGRERGQFVRLAKARA